MTLLKMILWSSVSVGALGILGCDLFVGGRAREDRVYMQPAQPVYVDQQPQYVVVQQAPPPLIVERRPAPPSVDYVWIDGAWNWDSQRYTWQAGRYEIPPQRGAVWVAPRYDGGAHRYTRGQWQKKDQGNDRGRGRGG